MKGYKAFSPGLVCRGKQYAENTTVKEDVTPKACAQGMHFCEEPLAVLDYYPLLDDDCNLPDFAEVESLGETHTDDHKKFATNKLHIGKKISLDSLINAEVDYIKDKTNAEPASGARSMLSASGWGSMLSASGWGSKLVASGERSKLSSSGDGSMLSASGERSKLSASGWGSMLSSSGERSIATAIGAKSKVKAAFGSWIVLAEYTDEGEILTVKSAKVDGETLKPDTWYTLENGEFKEVQ